MSPPCWARWQHGLHGVAALLSQDPVIRLNWRCRRLAEHVGWYVSSWFGWFTHCLQNITFVHCGIFLKSSNNWSINWSDWRLWIILCYESDLHRRHRYNLRAVAIAACHSFLHLLILGNRSKNIYRSCRSSRTWLTVTPLDSFSYAKFSQNNNRFTKTDLFPTNVAGFTPVGIEQLIRGTHLAPRDVGSSRYGIAVTWQTCRLNSMVSLKVSIHRGKSVTSCIRGCVGYRSHSLAWYTWYPQGDTPTVKLRFWN